EKIEQVVRLVRSKGVGVYFATQNPLDIPESVLAQIGNRIQHSMRAFTENDQRNVRAIARTFRTEEAGALEQTVTQLAIGEAVVSLLDLQGTPSNAARVWIAAPHSRMGAISAEERRRIIAASPVAGVYDQPVDRESAYEKLKSKADASPAAGTAQ